MLNGYRMVGLDGTKYLEHRIIYHMMILRLTTRDYVDHKDHDHQNNALNNLRRCSHSENLTNQPERQRRNGLPKHVYYSIRERKYKVQLRAKGKVHFIGTYNSLYKAKTAAVQARSMLHGEFGRR